MCPCHRCIFWQISQGVRQYKDYFLGILDRMRNFWGKFAFFGWYFASRGGNFLFLVPPVPQNKDFFWWYTLTHVNILCVLSRRLLLAGPLSPVSRSDGLEWSRAQPVGGLAVKFAPLWSYRDLGRPDGAGGPRGPGHRTEIIQVSLDSLCAWAVCHVITTQRTPPQWGQFPFLSYVIMA